MPKKSDVTRRQVVQMAGAVTAAAAVSKVRAKAAPGIQRVKAASNVVNYAVIGTGGRGQYHLMHFNNVDGGRCVAVCDIDDKALEKAKSISKDKPQGYKDYREVLARKDIDAVVISTPLYVHFPVTKDALLAGKHVFCEKSLVFTPEEVHELRKLARERPKQVLQVGLQRRYSQFYQTAKQMVQKGMLGKVTHVFSQWNRNPGWTMKPNAWRLYRKYSGGLVAELASHQIDVADWMFDSHPEFVMGVGGQEFIKDGRDVFDNVQLVYKYPKGQKLMCYYISTNRHCPMFYSERNEFGEMIMGTEGTIHITVGSDNEPATALWFYDPSTAPTPTKAGDKKEKAAVAQNTLLSTGKGARGLPLVLDRELVKDSDSFLAKELKFAKLWLYKKGVIVPEEPKNPVDVQLEEFLDSCRTGKRPKADLEIGLGDSVNVMLGNLCMDEGRRVYMSEIDKMGGGPRA